MPQLDTTESGTEALRRRRGQGRAAGETAWVQPVPWERWQLMSDLEKLEGSWLLEPPALSGLKIKSQVSSEGRWPTAHPVHLGFLDVISLLLSKAEEEKKVEKPSQELT